MRKMILFFRMKKEREKKNYFRRIMADLYRYSINTCHGRSEHPADEKEVSRNGFTFWRILFFFSKKVRKCGVTNIRVLSFVRQVKFSAA